MYIRSGKNIEEIQSFNEYTVITMSALDKIQQRNDFHASTPFLIVLIDRWHYTSTLTCVKKRWGLCGLQLIATDLIGSKIRIRYNANPHFLFFSDLFLNYLYLVIVY